MRFSGIKKNLFSFLQKRHRLIAFCMMALAILLLGLFAINFINSNVLTKKSPGSAIEDLRINKRLYLQVSEKMREDAERPVLGIGGARNPFYQE
ncbi:MAG: hypothetical protein Q8N68_00730 [bacterium]|nr:hypothetical protein [bacterium]